MTKKGAGFFPKARALFAQYFHGPVRARSFFPQRPTCSSKPSKIGFSSSATSKYFSCVRQLRRTFPSFKNAMSAKL